MAKSREKHSADSEYQEKTEELRQKSRRRTIFILVAAVVIIAAVLLCLRSCQTKGNDGLQRDVAAKSGIMPGMTDTEITDRLNRVVKDSEVNVAMNAQPVLENGVLNVGIENVPANKFAFRVKVVLDETQKTLFETDIIDPNHYLETVKVSEKLEPGAHDALATFTCYDPETLQVAGATGLKIVVLVSGEKEEP